MIHPAHVLFSPYVKIKVGKLFELKKEQQPVRPAFVWKKKGLLNVLGLQSTGIS